MVTTIDPTSPVKDVFSIAIPFDDQPDAAADPRHDALLRYFATLLGAYFELCPIGHVCMGGPVMLLGGSARRPDLQVILHVDSDWVAPTVADLPSDIVIEIVSPDSVARDHGQKLAEYEQGKVPEYWIIDPIHQEARFYRLGADGVYAPQKETPDGEYETPALPGLKISVPELWQGDLPGPTAITRSVEEMLKEDGAE